MIIEISLVGTPVAAASTQGHNGSIRVGANGGGGDLAENDSSTGTTLNPWLEFAYEFLAENVAPGTPTVTIDDQDENSVTLHTSAFSNSDVGPNGDHIDSQYQVALDADTTFSSPVADETHSGDAQGLTSAVLTGLSAGTNYRVRARHKDASDDAASEWSAWSTAATFATDSVVVDDLDRDMALVTLDQFEKVPDIDAFEGYNLDMISAIDFAAATVVEIATGALAFETLDTFAADGETDGIDPSQITRTLHLAEVGAFTPSAPTQEDELPRSLSLETLDEVEANFDQAGGTDFFEAALTIATRTLMRLQFKGRGVFLSLLRRRRRR